ncbi:MAG: dissimilatory-type sulfite reductase subunit beta [Caldilineae bacterium]|nr:MAG: dissimilatory-type sulfite reductase subunit beta [Caldilineae bacterium]
MPGIGVPSLKENLPPIIQRNYGQWEYHEVPRPGVLKHVARSGEVCFTVRAGMPPNGRVSTELARQICEVADRYTGGFLRITRRQSLELVGVPEEQIDEVIAALNDLGLPVGGVDRTVHNVVSCTGWLHCQFASTDAPGVAKVLSDALYETFQTESLPAKLKISVSGCTNNCGEASTADIGIIGIHREIPRVIDEEVSKCEIPLIISVCPTGAIRPKPPKSVTITAERCIHCVNCLGQCPGMPIGTPETDGVAVYVGGKAGNAMSGPSFAKLVIPYLPNNAPRWPETVEAVTNIVKLWADNARPHERIRDWIERIGWERFFEKAGLEMTTKHIDGYLLWPMAARVGVRFHW